MSQEKAQLIAPLGHFTVPGLNVSGVVTATSFSGNCTGTASSITKGASLVVGVMTASSFVGDVTGNVTGIGSNTDNLDVGIVTATSFAGNFTGIGSGLTGTPNVVAGVVTATKFVGNTPGTVSKLSDGTNINVGVVTATKFVGNTSGLAGGISAAQNINVGVLTATGGLYGDGSGLTGAGTTGFVKQDVTAQSGTTTINLNLGNIIYLTHSNNTTIAFSNVPTATDITIIRTLTDNTLTWPSGITWNGGSAPTIIGSNTRSTAGQVFNLVTYNGGTNWYGHQDISNDPQFTALWASGFNQTGRLGDGTTTQRSSPVQIPGDGWITPRGQDGGFAAKTDGTLWSWGGNTYGTLGHNNTSQYSSPKQIPGTTWSADNDLYDNSYYLSSALKTDGTLWCWGNNQNGQLGQNNNVAHSSPVQVPGDFSSVTAIEVGHHLTMQILKGTELWVWGSGDMGQLGQGYYNSQYHRSSPVQIPGSYQSISNAYRRMGAVKTNGELYTWGYGSFGGLGQNTATQRNSPYKVGSDTNWLSVHMGGGAWGVGAAVKTTGELWMWGQGTNGCLGQNDRTNLSSPVQVPGTTWTSKICVAGADNVFAEKSDGTFWCWGNGANGAFGALGNNDTVSYSSPVQISGNWISGTLSRSTSNRFYALKESDT